MVGTSKRSSGTRCGARGVAAWTRRQGRDALQFPSANRIGALLNVRSVLRNPSTLALRLCWQRGSPSRFVERHASGRNCGGPETRNGLHPERQGLQLEAEHGGELLAVKTETRCDTRMWGSGAESWDRMRAREMRACCAQRRGTHAHGPLALTPSPSPCAKKHAMPCARLPQAGSERKRGNP